VALVPTSCAPPGARGATKTKAKAKADAQSCKAPSPNDGASKPAKSSSGQSCALRRSGAAAAAAVQSAVSASSRPVLWPTAPSTAHRPSPPLHLALSWHFHQRPAAGGGRRRRGPQMYAALRPRPPPPGPPRGDSWPFVKLSRIRTRPGADLRSKQGAGGEVHFFFGFYLRRRRLAQQTQRWWSFFFKSDDQHKTQPCLLASLNQRTMLAGVFLSVTPTPSSRLTHRVGAPV
jgi:hypothetical protein